MREIEIKELYVEPATFIAEHYYDVANIISVRSVNNGKEYFLNGLRCKQISPNVLFFDDIKAGDELIVTYKPLPPQIVYEE